MNAPAAPLHPIARGHAGPSLLAMILASKFLLHQPLHRQSATIPGRRNRLRPAFRPSSSGMTLRDASSASAIPSTLPKSTPTTSAPCSNRPGTDRRSPTRGSGHSRTRKPRSSLPRSARGAAYPDLRLILPMRGHVDKIRRSLDVSNFAQPSPWNGRSSAASSVTVQLTAR